MKRKRALIKMHFSALQPMGGAGGGTSKRVPRLAQNSVYLAVLIARFGGGESQS